MIAPMPWVSSTNRPPRPRRARLKLLGAPRAVNSPPRLLVHSADNQAEGAVMRRDDRPSGRSRS